ncbi:MAG: T9SS type A sorting domain-containing protein [Anaerolineae bacterium]|nr:T9SS type A sorting domain-containing protein [Anaerolineae bacterium]MCI0698677.1 T9SS type A sorting domain-containing protein [candidate division KSB1 bacterium]
MKNQLKLLAAAGMKVVLLFAVLSPVTAQTLLDQSFTSPLNLGAVINVCCKFAAQTFTAELTGTLAGVNINVEFGGSIPLHVAIRTVTGGVPSPTILGETTLSSSSAPLSLLITFPQTINIVAGTQYAIVLDYEGAPPGQFQGTWTGAVGDLYTGGDLYFSLTDGITWFASGPGHDVHFQTYVTVAPSVIEATIDIKPGSDPNSINPKSKDVIPVAILTTASFDATTVDPLSVAFGPDGATESHGKGHIEDADGDGDMDLVLHFKTQDTGIQCGDTEASLTGQTCGGQAITGSDAIQTVGCGSAKAMAEAEAGIPEGYALLQNYPNPFNPETEIRFQLLEASHVVVKIFNTVGEEIRTLVEAEYEAGYHRVRWDGKDKNGHPVASGIYLYQLLAGNFSQVRKMSLLR